MGTLRALPNSINLPWSPHIFFRIYAPDFSGSSWSSTKLGLKDTVALLQMRMCDVRQQMGNLGNEGDEEEEKEEEKEEEGSESTHTERNKRGRKHNSRRRKRRDGRREEE